MRFFRFLRRLDRLRLLRRNNAFDLIDQSLNVRRQDRFVLLFFFIIHLHRLIRQFFALFFRQLFRLVRQFFALFFRQFFRLVRQFFALFFKQFFCFVRQLFAVFFEQFFRFISREGKFFCFVKNLIQLRFHWFAVCGLFLHIRFLSLLFPSCQNIFQTHLPFYLIVCFNLSFCFAFSSFTLHVLFNFLHLCCGRRFFRLCFLLIRFRHDFCHFTGYYSSLSSVASFLDSFICHTQVCN